MSRTTNTQSGFTFIEVLVVVAILAILSYVLSVNFIAYREKAALHGAAEAIAFELGRAHADALSGKDGLSQSVYFSSDEYVRFSGETYDSDDGDNASSTIDTQLTISTTLSDDILTFSRLSGVADETATVTVALIDDSSEYEQIVIGERGDVTLISN